MLTDQQIDIVIVYMPCEDFIIDLMEFPKI